MSKTNKIEQLQKLTFKKFMEYTNTEYETALFFREYTTVKYIHSKSYNYKFNDKTKLWEEINEDVIGGGIAMFFLDIQPIIIKELNDTIKKLNEKLYTAEDEQKEKIKQNITQTESNKKTFLSSVKFLSSKKSSTNIIYFLKPMITIDEFQSKLNRKYPYYLPIKNNMIVDLRNGRVIHRERKHYFTFFCDVEITKTKTNFFNDFISKIMCEDMEAVKYLQKILGYCLTGDITGRVFFIWSGIGKNGKSVLLNLMKRILGSSYKQTTKDVFINSNKSSGCEVVELKDARLASYSETNSKECLNESLIKMISGDDPITARALYKSPITFDPMCKLLLLTNHKPTFNGEDLANIDRVRLVQFPARFVQCPNPKKKSEYKQIDNMKDILINKHIDEFFTFCVEGAIEFYKDSQFKPPSFIKDVQDEYLKKNASISTWFENALIITEDDADKIDRSKLYDSYMNYCVELGIEAFKKSVLFEKIEQILETKAQKNNGIYKFKGIKFIEQENNEIINNEENELINKKQKNSVLKFNYPIKKKDDHGLDEDLIDEEEQEKINNFLRK